MANIRCCGRSWKGHEDWDRHKRADHRCRDCDVSHPMFVCTYCATDMLCNLCRDRHHNFHQSEALSGGEL